MMFVFKNFNAIQIKIIYKTSFHIAFDKGNIDIVKLLLESDKLNVNMKSVLKK